MMNRRSDTRFNCHEISEINMVPMIDVMLVLVVILLVTAPVLTRSIPLVLPKTQAVKTNQQQTPIQISINEQGAFFWNGVETERDHLRIKMQNAVSQAKLSDVDLPGVQIRADHRAPYRYVAYVLSDAATYGLTKIGFVSQRETQ